MEEYKPSTTKLPFQGDERYDVFLSFRGQDVREALVDRLFEALSAEGLNVFLDIHSLKRGDNIGMSIRKAIEVSAICIPIFSKTYADSAWCLRDAALMLRSPGLIIPLYYDVDPSDVRDPLKESSAYMQSFQRHYAHTDLYSREEIDGWRYALIKISSRSGWSMAMSQGSDARLVEKVVKDLVEKLDIMSSQVDKHPVGLERIKNVLIGKLDLKLTDVVVKIGIWGTGGIGKTTFAKALYSQIYADFDAASFVSNVRTSAADLTGLTRLQKQLLKELTQYNGVASSVDKGITLFRDRLVGLKVLVILDDVDDVIQLNALVGDWLAPGSRVIITSRDKHILNVAGMSSDCIHEMVGLDIYDGLQLFRRYAFRGSPIGRHENVSNGIVEACKGHPLSLEVIGSFLYDKQDDTVWWIDAHHNIIFSRDIHDILKISYDYLSDEEKEIFVDIACFFIGEQKTRPIVFWKSLYKKVDNAVRNLLMKSLIKIDNGVFDMHDHLRDMGRIIAEKEKGRTRLWEAAQVNTQSDINLSRLRLNKCNPLRLDTLYTPDLRYLDLQNLPIEGMTEDTLHMLPPSLIWLRLEHCSFATGTDRAVNKLHHSKVVEVWQLKIMQLKGCSNLDSLFISSLFSLPYIQLQHLDLGGCIDLKNLPDTIGNLSEMRYLYLGGCRNLNHLPDTLGNLSKLQHLDLEGCINLKNLPNTTGSLSELKHLDLGWCGSLENLPETIGDLSQLQHFMLRGCERLNNLPDTIGNLLQLQLLNMVECLSLTNLPDAIGNLVHLQHFNLEGCVSLNSLPDSIGNLPQLQHLDLEGCVSLNSLPKSIGNLSQLQHLDLRSNDKLNELPDAIGNLSQLRHLYLGGCRSLNNLPDTIGNLSQLQHLDLEGCINLKNLSHTIGNLSQLQHLDLGWCGSLKNLPDTIGNLSQLQYLKLRGCERLKKLPSTMVNLSHLEFSF